MFLLVSLLGLLSPNASVIAKDTPAVIVSTPDLSQFPQVSLDLNLQAIPNLPPSSVTLDQLKVTEDGNTITPDSVNIITPGLQTILAMNVGGYMAVDYRRQTLFHYVQLQLLDWLSRQINSSRDDYNFVTNADMALSHAQDPQLLADTLSAYKPNLPEASPSNQALSQALEIASESLPRASMQRAVFYLTVVPNAKSVAAYASITDQAVRLGVKVFVILVAPAGTSGTSLALPLSQLAEKTGGQFFSFSGPETLPDLESWFQPLRSFLQVGYTSQVTQSGDHRVSVQITGAGVDAVSPVTLYSITISPPNPFFLSPPSALNRTWRTSAFSGNLELTPGNAQFQIMIEFPDGHPRSLQFSRLYLDGNLVTEIDKAPFDQFTLDLSSFTQTATHTLQVEVGDVLGKTSKTVLLPVNIQVQAPPQSFLSKVLGFLSRGPVLTLIIVLTGAVILSILLVTTNRNLQRNLRSKMSKKEFNDPVTQPVQVKMESALRQPAASHEFVPVPEVAEKPFARLVRLSEVTQEIVPGAIILLTHTDTTLGNDPRITTISIPSASISPIHARIRMLEGGKFTINDENSIAGTWVNYAPVSPQGAHLEHGDLVSLGKLLYRFEVLNQPLPKIIKHL